MSPQIIGGFSQPCFACSCSVGGRGGAACRSLAGSVPFNLPDFPRVWAPSAAAGPRRRLPAGLARHSQCAAASGERALSAPLRWSFSFHAVWRSGAFLALETSRWPGRELEDRVSWKAASRLELGGSLAAPAWLGRLSLGVRGDLRGFRRGRLSGLSVGMAHMGSRAHTVSGGHDARVGSPCFDRPTSAGNRQLWRQRGHCFPNSSKFGRALAKFGRKECRIQTTSPQIRWICVFGPSWLDFERIGPNSDPSSAQLRSDSTKFGRNRDELGPTRLNLSTLDRFGQIRLESDRIRAQYAPVAGCGSMGICTKHSGDMDTSAGRTATTRRLDAHKRRGGTKLGLGRGIVQERRQAGRHDLDG